MPKYVGHSTALSLKNVYDKKVSPDKPEAGVWFLNDLQNRSGTGVVTPPVETVVTISDPSMPFWLEAGLPSGIFTFTDVSQSLALAVTMSLKTV